MPQQPDLDAIIKGLNKILTEDLATTCDSHNDQNLNTELAQEKIDRISQGIGHLKEVALLTQKVQSDNLNRVTDLTNKLLLANDELKQTQAQLLQSQKMEAIGTLAGSIAHDFNNILASIIGNVDTWKIDHEQDAEDWHYFENISHAANHAVDLVKQILTFSRKEVTAHTNINLIPILNECLGMLRSTIPTHINITQDLTLPSAIVSGNKTQITQVILNLCTNAFHAINHNHGNITISLKEDEACFVILEISDNGSGVSKDTLPHIFDPFFTTKDIHKGTGLGLSVVHGIIEKHGGSIHVESEVDQGTRFIIHLPLADDHHLHESDTDDSIVYATDKGKHTILLVEDEKTLALIYKKFLIKIGYHVDCCNNGNEGLQHFSNDPNKYSIVLSDNFMPEMTGVELSKEILKIRASTPIILTSGNNHDSQEMNGITHFLLKPVRLSLLSKVVHDILELQNR